MLVIGLTGGIAMGKSTVAQMFVARGIPVFNADRTVHALQAPGGRAIPAIAAAFPGSVVNGVLNRAALRAVVLADRPSLKRLEAIMHPLVRRMERQFIAAARRRRARAILLDIPLLFETHGERNVDVVIAVSCPRDVQIQRVLRRKTMSPDQVRAILAQQLPDAERRRRADYVVRTGLSRFHTHRTVHRIFEDLLP